MHLSSIRITAFIAATALLFSSGNARLAAQNTGAVGRASASSNTPKLIAADASPKGAGLHFNFGKRSVFQIEEVDDKRAPDSIAMPDINDGPNHVFTLINPGERPVTIKEIQESIPCATTTFTIYGKWADLPIRVLPKAKVQVKVLVHADVIAPGPLDISLHLIGDKNTKLASLRMTGDLVGPIKFSPPIKFGSWPRGESVSRAASITIDRRIQGRLPDSDLKIVCSNPNVRVWAAPGSKKMYGVKVKGNTITFPSPLGDELPADVKIRLWLTVNPSAPSGKVSGRVFIDLPGFPAYMLFQDTDLRFDGTVMGKK